MQTTDDSLLNKKEDVIKIETFIRRHSDMYNEIGDLTTKKCKGSRALNSYLTY